jgi:hypothetical protein
MHQLLSTPSAISCNLEQQASLKKRTRGMVLMPSAVPRRCGGHVSASTPLAVLPYAATAAGIRQQQQQQQQLLRPHTAFWLPREQTSATMYVTQPLLPQ